MEEKWMAYWDNVNVELYALVKQVKQIKTNKNGKTKKNNNGS